MALKDLLVKLRLDNSQFKAGLKDSTKELDKMARSASSLDGALQMVGVAGIAMIVQKLGSAVWGLGEMGAASMRLETALGSLATAAGGSADDIVNAIRNASRGTISEMEIIASANKGILLGLGADAEQWGSLVEVASFRARAMGLSTAQALSDITTGIGRESRLILDNLGIILDMDKVTQDYAKSVGKTVEQLSAAERKQAILNSVITEGQTQIAAAGGLAMDAASSFEALTAATANLKDALAQKLAPVVADIAGILTYIASAMGPDLETHLLNAALAAKEAGGGFEAMARAAMHASTVGTDLDYPFQKLQAMGAASKLTAEQLFQIGEVAGATDSQILALADTLGIDVPDAFLAARRAAAELAREAGRLGTSFGTIENAARDAIGPVYNLAKAYEFLYDNIADKARARITGEPVFSTGDLYELEAGGTGASDALAQQQVDNAERRAEAEEAAAKRTTKAWESSYDAQEQAYNDLRSTIESALSATSVTALDMFQTGQGTYTDKWDENARRADAVARGGFGELQAHPDWAAALKIPPEILTANEDVLKEWAANTSDQIRNLVRPDLLVENMDAAVAAVRQYMQDEAAKELSIDLIANAMIGEGLMDPEDAKAKVAQALGLDQTMAGTEIGQQMMDGLNLSLEGSQPAQQFATYLQQDTEAQSALLKTTGENLWAVVNAGIYHAMNHTDYIKKLAQLIAPEVAQILQEWGVWGGTTP